MPSREGSTPSHCQVITGVCNWWLLHKNWQGFVDQELEAAIEVGPHISALDPKAMEQLQAEVSEKETKDQAQAALWDNIKDDLPKALQISRIAMVPNKLRKSWAILDLSYTIKLVEREI